MLWELINSPVAMIIYGTIIAQALRMVVKRYSVTGKQEFILVASTVLVFILMTAILQGIGSILVTILSVKLAIVLLREE